MTEVIATALQMRCDVAKLMRARGVSLEPQRIALAAPVSHTVELTGLAATTDIDLGRQKFRGWAFTNLCLTLSGYPKPPLYCKHDETAPVGTIKHLSYDERGNLTIVAETDHPLASRCGGFSVGARVLEYKIVDNGGADFYGLITKAEITEISLTDCPANPKALVRTRDRAVMSDYVRKIHEHTDLFAKAFDNMRRQVEAMQKFVAMTPSRPQAAVTTRSIPRPRLPVEPHPQTSFGALVSQIERNHHV